VPEARLTRPKEAALFAQGSILAMCLLLYSGPFCSRDFQAFPVRSKSEWSFTNESSLDVVSASLDHPSATLDFSFIF